MNQVLALSGMKILIGMFMEIIYLMRRLKAYFQKKHQPLFGTFLFSVYGDLRIIFSNMLMLECFINVSANQECWRFFKHGEKKHWVVYGNGKEFQ